MKKSHTGWIRNGGKYRARAMKKSHTGWIRNGGKYMEALTLITAGT